MKEIFIGVMKIVAVIISISLTLIILFNEDTTRNTGKKVIILDRDTGTVVSQRKLWTGRIVTVIYRNEIGDYTEKVFQHDQVKIIDEKE